MQENRTKQKFETLLTKKIGVKRLGCFFTISADYYGNVKVYSNSKHGSLHAAIFHALVRTLKIVCFNEILKH